MQTLVIDNGSGQVKAGFAGDDVPRSVFPSVVGRTNHVLATNERDTFVGDAAQLRRETLSLTYPIEQGVVTDWNAMEKLWHFTFYEELRVAPEEHTVLLTEPPQNPRENREKTTSMMFETFNCHAMYLADQATLALYASGRTTGIVLDSGNDVTHAVPIYEGIPITHAILRLDLAGKHLTEHLSRMLEGKGYTFTENLVNSIKEHSTFVAFDFAKQMTDCPTTFQPPADATTPFSVMMLGNERFRCPEPLFDPSMLGIESVGVHEMIYNAVRKCDTDLHKDMFRNIILSGGSTLFDGIAQRLQEEIRSLIPVTWDFKVVALGERKYSTWIGGSILGMLSSFQPKWISKQDYDEEGPGIVRYKCM